MVKLLRTRSIIIIMDNMVTTAMPDYRIYPCTKDKTASHIGMGSICSCRLLVYMNVANLNNVRVSTCAEMLNNILFNGKM